MAASFSEVRLHPFLIGGKVNPKNGEKLGARFDGLRDLVIAAGGLSLGLFAIYRGHATIGSPATLVVGIALALIFLRGVLKLWRVSL